MLKNLCNFTIHCNTLSYIMNKTYELDCMGERLLLTPLSGESINDTLFRDFGWLLKPIMNETKSFEKTLDKLNWKIVEIWK
jgi:hypothetical protein